MPQPYDLKAPITPSAMGAQVAQRPGSIWLLAILAALAAALMPPPWWQLGIITVALAACLRAARIGAAALRFSLWAALIFVVLRVAYRVIFTSTATPSADAVLLLDLPAIALGGPFRGIALFGPLALDALLATLVEASRFAAVFIVFGAANALADARTLLARAPRVLLPIATVLSLALGSVPALLASVQRVSFAARLRGERRGPRLLVPVFEQAVERATALGASMELRGFGSSHLETAEPGTPGQPLLRAEGLGVSHGRRAILADIDLELRAGELTVVTGPTGSGKSTLLSALARLAPAYTGGEVVGSLEIGGVRVEDQRPARLAGALALVPQRVEHSFLAETVRAELSFAPTRRGLSAARIDAETAAALRRFNLEALVERDPATLSAGEATRVSIAAAHLAGPRVLLLDEPVADLDPASVEAVRDALRGLLAEGCAVLIAEHRHEALAALFDEVPVRRFELREGVLSAPSFRPSAEARRIAAPHSGEHAMLRAHRSQTSPSRSCAMRGGATDPHSRTQEGGRAEPIALASNLTVERGGRELLRVEVLFARAGEIVVLSGPNGSGKTSLLEEIALGGEAQRQRVRRESKSMLAGGIALVPHRVDELLIRQTLADECRFADRRAVARKGTTARRFERLIAGSILAPEALATTHPRDLSAGTRLALAIAVQLAHEPRVLLLDEPTRGLDASARRRLAELLTGLAAEGRAVLLASHDAQFAELLAEVGCEPGLLRIESGVLR